MKSSILRKRCTWFDTQISRLLQSTFAPYSTVGPFDTDAKRVPGSKASRPLPVARWASLLLISLRGTYL